MNKLKKFFKFNLHGEQGGVVILVAVSLIVLLGLAALVIDFGALYLARRQMVNAADATALAAVLAKNEAQAKKVAKEYADKNGAVGFDSKKDLEYEKHGGIVSVRVSRPVEFTFAQVLPGINEPSTLVGAIASAGKGPGNAIVPFVDVAWKFVCPCETACTCPVDCTCDPCECVDECTCPPCECEADCPCENGCTCLKFEYENQPYYIKNDEGTLPIKEFERFQLKYERWQYWEYDTSGVFPYLRLGDLSGGSDLSGAIAGGYEGNLEDVATGTDHMAEPGGTGGQGGGPLISGLESRLLMVGDPYCTHPDDLDDSINDETGYRNWYNCDLVVIMPLVVEKIHPKNFVIGGYATVLLDLEYGPTGKEVWAYFLEYLTYEDLMNLYPEGVLRNFTVRLIRHDSAFSN